MIWLLNGVIHDDNSSQNKENTGDHGKSTDNSHLSEHVGDQNEDNSDSGHDNSLLMICSINQVSEEVNHVVWDEQDGHWTHSKLIKEDCDIDKVHEPLGIPSEKRDFTAIENTFGKMTIIQSWHTSSEKIV